MKKIYIILPVLVFISASCALFGTQATGGMAKTVNGGADWQISNTVKNSKTTLLNTSMTSLGFDPGNREVVYASTLTGGLYKSEDSGATWFRILSTISVYDFVVDPVDGKIIYAAGIYNGHGRLLVTRDGGSSWNQIYNDASLENPVRSVALNPQNTTQIIIGLSSGSIIKSFDSGLSWKLARDFGSRVNDIIWQNGTLYILFRDKGLLSSTDFAENFTQLTLGIDSPTFIKNLPTSQGQLFYNRFFVDRLSSDLLYVTTTLGLFKTVDGGKNWAYISLPVPPAQNQPHAIAVASKSSNIVYTSIGSTIYKSADGGQTFQTQKVATTGIINYILIDPELPQIAYAAIWRPE